MKKSINTIKQYDYISKEEFLKDIGVMKNKGYILIEDGMYGGILDHHEIDSDIYKYTACFTKSTLS